MSDHQYDQHYVVVLPYRTVPLTLNQRLHHMARHRITTQVKGDVARLARHLKIPTMTAVTAELVWFKGDNRRADADNISPTLKAAVDGLVQAGVLRDDNASVVLRTSTRVVLKRDNPSGARLELRIRDMSVLPVETT